jgi:hypothetical protein
LPAGKQLVLAEDGRQARHSPENVRRLIVFRRKDKFDEVELCVLRLMTAKIAICE